MNDRNLLLKLKFNVLYAYDLVLFACLYFISIINCVDAPDKTQLSFWYIHFGVVSMFFMYVHMHVSFMWNKSQLDERLFG